MKKIKDVLFTYSVELIIMFGSVFIMSYSKSLIGPMEGRGLGDLFRVMHNIEQYESIASICQMIMLIDLLVMIVHYVFNKKGIKIKLVKA